MRMQEASKRKPAWEALIAFTSTGTSSQPRKTSQQLHSKTRQIACCQLEAGCIQTVPTLGGQQSKNYKNPVPKCRVPPQR